MQFENIEIKKFCEFEPITKAQEELKEVSGVVLYSEKRDLQGEIYSKETIKKSMTTYMEYFQHVGIMHKKLGNAFILENIQNENGDWFITAKIKDDNIWQDIKKRRLTGFSIGGLAGGHWEDEKKSTKRLTEIITKEISLVDIAANGGMFTACKRFDEGGENMEKEMKEALEKSSKDLADAQKKMKDEVDLKLQEITKKVEGQDAKFTDWDTSLKSLHEKLEPKAPPDTSEITKAYDKKFADILELVAKVVEKQDEIMSRFEQPIHKGLVPDKSRDRNFTSTGDPKVDMVMKNMEYFKDPDVVKARMTQGLNVEGHFKTALQALRD